MEYEFAMAMYNKLNELKDQNKKDLDEFNKMDGVASIEEKKEFCKKMQVVVDDYRALKEYYVKFDSHPTVELMNEIKTKFAYLLNNEPVINKPTIEEPVVNKPTLNNEDDQIRNLVNPVIKPVLKTNTDTTTEPKFVDGNLKNVNDWALESGFVITNPKGFTPEQLKDDYKMTADEFYTGLFNCGDGYEFVLGRQL